MLDHAAKRKTKRKMSSASRSDPSLSHCGIVTFRGFHVSKLLFSFYYYYIFCFYFFIGKLGGNFCASSHHHFSFPFVVSLNAAARLVLLLLRGILPFNAEGRSEAIEAKTVRPRLCGPSGSFGMIRQRNNRR